MTFTQKWTAFTGIALFIGPAIGCDEWPRYQHQPTINGSALGPAEAPNDAISIDWADLTLSEEVNNTPNDPVSLEVGEGLILEGNLEGMGWSADENPDRLSDCGETRAFPPASPGDYIGDIDWISITPAQNAILCLDLKTDMDSARLDAPLYVLDDCSEPISVFVEADTESMR